MRSRTPHWWYVPPLWLLVLFCLGNLVSGLIAVKAHNDATLFFILSSIAGVWLVIRYQQDKRRPGK